MARVQSGPSRRACYLRYINQTARRVNVIWVDYSGCHRNYGTVEPNRHFDIHTYEGHPWVCEDSVTNNRMLLNRMEIFYPASPSNHPQPNDVRRDNSVADSNNELIPNGIHRQYVYITLPVFSLLELCAKVVVTNLRNRGDVRSLKIPTILKRKLQSMNFHP